MKSGLSYIVVPLRIIHRQVSVKCWILGRQRSRGISETEESELFSNLLLQCHFFFFFFFKAQVLQLLVRIFRTHRSNMITAHHVLLRSSTSSQEYKPAPSPVPPADRQHLSTPKASPYRAQAPTVKYAAG